MKEQHDTAQAADLSLEMLANRVARVAHAAGVNAPKLTGENVLQLASAVLGSAAMALESTAQAEESVTTECGNCFEGKSDFDHVCKKCGGSGKAAESVTAVDQSVMELAESVGLIGPASRTHDLHAAIQRFHDLICVNATIKAAAMAAEVTCAAARAPAESVGRDAELNYEQRHAIRQGHEIAASDGYFEARPQIDNNDRRKVFQAGFERGWDSAMAANGGNK